MKSALCHSLHESICFCSLKISGGGSNPFLFGATAADDQTASPEGCLAVGLMLPLAKENLPWVRLSQTYTCIYSLHDHKAD